jgi:uncharacterized damage-inducible protein DinB
MVRLLLFLTLLFCNLSPDAGAQSVDSLFVRAAFSKLQGAREYTLQVARLMPAEYYSFKPDADEMTFGEQLLHLSQNLGWLSSYYLNNKAQNPVIKSDIKLQEKDSVLAVVVKAYDYALEVMKNFPPDKLNDGVTFFAGPMRKLQIINLLNDHQTHHRGQLIVYLRMKGIRPPAYVGW